MVALSDNASGNGGGGSGGDDRGYGPLLTGHGGVQYADEEVTGSEEVTGWDVSVSSAVSMAIESGSLTGSS